MTLLDEKFPMLTQNNAFLFQLECFFFLGKILRSPYKGLKCVNKTLQQSIRWPSLDNYIVFTPVKQQRLQIFLQTAISLCRLSLN